MNTQQLHDLRLLWKQSPSKVVAKETALQVLDEAIKCKASSDGREAALQTLGVEKGRNTFGGNLGA